MPLQAIPQIGLGTSNIPPGDCPSVVELALNIGYRHIDTAQYYDTEAPVGEGIANADVDRDDIFLATKVRPENLGYEDVFDSVERSLNRLGVDRIDLLYVHGPAGEYDPPSTLEAFNELYDRDLFTHFGVSNFTPEQVWEAVELTDPPVYANQIEMHPLYWQEDLLEFARREGIQLVAYSPLARGKVFEVNPLEEIAAKHDASVAQVCIGWLLSKQNVVTIPKASSRAHLEDNYAGRELSLDPEDIERIDAIDRTEKVIDPFASSNPT